jgi:hypothetical protein
MRTFKFTVKNQDDWAICNTEIIVVAKDKLLAKKMLVSANYDINKIHDLIELTSGIHIIQEMSTM